MSGLLFAVGTASLLGSLHCLGMCGPFALMAGTSGGIREEGSAPAIRLWPTLGYHLGRLILYSLIGLTFGALGMAVNLGGSLAGFQTAATYGAGTMMILVGLLALGRQMGWNPRLPSVAPWVTGPLQRLLRRVRQLPGLLRSVALGMLTSLMPCGWLYVFAITAAGVADPWKGWLVMFVFWSGTVPILLASVFGAGQLVRMTRLNVPMATAIMVIAIGCFTLIYRAPIQLGNQPLIPATSNVAAQIESLENIDHSELPCCSGQGKEL